MFRGQFQHSVDTKGRVSLPARFRDALSVTGDGRFVLTPAPFDPCLRIYPMREWEDLEERIAELSSLDPHIVRFRRLFVSAACECEPDRAGRVLVPPHLRDKARLDKEALWAGMGRHLELWSKTEWDAALNIDADQMENFRQAVLEHINL